MMRRTRSRSDLLDRGRAGRRHRAVAAATAAAGLALGGCAATHPQRLTVREVVLQDADGRTRAALTTMAGWVELQMLDATGRSRAVLSVGADGVPVLALYDERGRNRAGVGLAADGAPAIVLYDKEGKPRAVLGSAPLKQRADGEVQRTDPASLLFVDDAGRVTFKAPP